MTEALRLFADRGFRGTTIADIEAAAGLSPGSGSLYGHFATKEDVLAAAIARSVALAEAGYSAYDVLPLGDLRAELTLLVRGSLLVMDTWVDLIRLLFKEAAQFPELLDDARHQIIERAYRWISDWLTGKVKTGELADIDPDAVAVIALGAVSNYWLHAKLLDWRPAGVDQDRFVNAWVDLLLRLRS